MNSSTATTDLDNALQLIARRAQSLTLASGAAIALTWPEAEPCHLHPSDEMTCRASAGEDAPSVGARLRVGSGFSGECVREGKLLRCDDSESDPRVDRDSCRRLGIRSMVAVPVKDRKSVVGIIEIFSPRIRAFTEVDVNELQTLAALVASAMEGQHAAAKTATRNSPALSEVASLPPVVIAPIIFEETTPEPELELFGSDIFVSASLPWSRFLQSALWHVVALVAVWNVSFSWARSEQILRKRTFESSHVTYYKPSFPTAGSYRAPARPVLKARTHPALKPMSVRKGSGQATVAPPAVKLPTRGRLSLAAWTPEIPPRPRPAVAEAPALGTTTQQLASPGRPRLLEASVVGPAPQIGTALGERAVSAPGSFVVAPSPTVALGIRTGWNANIGHASVVAPAPSMPMHDQSNGSAVSLGGGTVVAPAPTIPSREQSKLSGVSLGGATAVVGPPPGMPLHDGPSTTGVGLDGSGSSVVAPAPSLAGSETLASLRGGALPGVGSQVAMPAPVLAGTGAVSGGAGRAAMNIPPSITPMPPRKLEDPNGTTQELPVRLLGLALALPSSSYFSNYEVFIAERRVAKDEARLIKLVYESRPYQRRMSEYGLDDSRVYKVRLKRDASCDETALQMAGSHYPELKSSTDHRGLSSIDQDSVLPCYRTTVDEYRKAVAKGR